eukprot:XP_017446888.1 PREDICTED: uncharacterized protein LOC108350204 isoform X1 [Rattus norvegicus]
MAEGLHSKLQPQISAGSKPNDHINLRIPTRAASAARCQGSSLLRTQKRVLRSTPSPAYCQIQEEAGEAVPADQPLGTCCLGSWCGLQNSTWKVGQTVSILLGLGTALRRRAKEFQKRVNRQEAGERSSGLINRDTETQHCIIHTYGSSLAGKERCGNSSDPQIALQLESNRCLFIHRRMKDGTNPGEFTVWSKDQFRTRDVPWQ